MDFTRDEFLNNYWKLVRQTIDRYGDKEFVVTPADTITYREADQRANVICAALRDILKNETGQGVGLFVNEHCAIIPAMIGALKSRNFFVPLDVNNPDSVLHYIFDAVGLKVILTVGPYFERVRSWAGDKIEILNIDELDFNQDIGDPEMVYSPDDIVQVLFTSGSTGQPKGVIENYRYLGRAVYLKVSSHTYKPSDRALHLSNFTYGGPHVSLFTALSMGYTLCYFEVKEEGLTGLPAWIQRQSITAFHSTPTLLRNLTSVLAPDETFPSVDAVHFGAEKRLYNDIQIIRKHFPAVERIRLGFSSTETQSVCSAMYPVDYDFGHKDLPSGYPQKDIKVYIWDEEGKSVPVGEEGEIVVYGDALARGYINNPELTKMRFIPDPDHPGWQYFKTGDWGKFLPDGQLAHLGRIDNMIKIRGIRIELDSIESHMLSYPGIVQVASRAFDDHKGNKRLASYFVAEKGAHIPISDLRNHLAERLPLQQLPHYLVQLDEMPLTVSGKVAINALPPPETVRPALSNEYVPPADELEKQLVAIWEEQIGISGIGVTDDFFEVGGDSLIGALVFASIDEVLGKELPVSTLLKAPTIREQAGLIRQGDIEQNFSPVIAIHAEGDRAPLFFVPGKGGYPTRIRHLARKIDPRTPIYALQDLVVDQPRQALRSVESIAIFFLSEMKKLYPHGPYVLLGESFGGLVVYEMAQQLVKTGEEAPVLALLDSQNQTASNINSYLKKNSLSTYGMWLKKHYTILRKSDWRGRKDYLKFYWETGGKKIGQFVGRRAKRLRKESESALPEGIRRNEQAKRRIGFAYRAHSYPGRVILFKAMLGSDSKDATNGWNKVSLGELVVYPLDCYHGGVLFEPAVSRVAEVMQDYIEKASH